MQISSRALLVIGLCSLFVTGANATENKKTKRSIANTQFSGSRVGSSEVYEIGALDEKGLQVGVTNFEKSEVIEKTSAGARISLVQVDSGGSTDISSAMASSRLYLIFYQDGEMNNTKAAFLLGGINSFTIKDKKEGVVTIEQSCKDEHLKPRKVTSVINYSKFLKSFKEFRGNGGYINGEEDLNDAVVSGSITMSGKCLPDYQ